MVKEVDLVGFGNKIHAMAANENIGINTKMVLNQLDVFFSIATMENMAFLYSLTDRVEKERGEELANFLKVMGISFSFSYVGMDVGLIKLSEDNPNLRHFAGFLEQLTSKYSKKYQQVISYMERKDYWEAEEEAKSLLESIEYRKKRSIGFYLVRLFILAVAVIGIMFLFNTWF